MKCMPRRRVPALALVGAAVLLMAGCSGGGDDGGAPVALLPVVPSAPAERKDPNILFIVIDDIGIDQLTSYGYGGAVPPRTPNLTAIAKAGLQFRQAWSMPTCTPTRATSFT